MAELGIVASVLQIADLGLRLSTKLYAFGKTIATAEKSIQSISKDISLTSSVLRQLGQTLEEDKKSRLINDNALQTADGIINECRDIFQEMDSIFMKRMPRVLSEEKEKGSKATVTTKLWWPYVRPKILLLRANLDRQKSTLLLMINVITYAKTLSNETEKSSSAAHQKRLIEELNLWKENSFRNFELSKKDHGEENTRRFYDTGIAATNQQKAKQLARLGNSWTQPSDLEPDAHLTPTEPFIPYQDPTLNSGANNGHDDSDLNMAFQVRGNNDWDENDIRRDATLSDYDLSGAEETELASSLNDFVHGPTKTLSLLAEPGSGGGKESERSPGPLSIWTKSEEQLKQDALLEHLRHYIMLITNLANVIDRAPEEVPWTSRCAVKQNLSNAYRSEMTRLENEYGPDLFNKTEQDLSLVISEFCKIFPVENQRPHSSGSPRKAEASLRSQVLSKAAGNRESWRRDHAFQEPDKGDRIRQDAAMEEKIQKDGSHHKGEKPASSEPASATPAAQALHQAGQQPRLGCRRPVRNEVASKASKKSTIQRRERRINQFRVMSPSTESFNFWSKPRRAVNISAPQNFRHITHVVYDSVTGDLHGLPEEWRRTLQETGFSKSEVAAAGSGAVELTFYAPTTSILRSRSRRTPAQPKMRPQRPQRPWSSPSFEIADSEPENVARTAHSATSGGGENDEAMSEESAKDVTQELLALWTTLGPT